MEFKEIIKKIIGSIEPYGDTNIDEERSKNLEIHMEVTYELIKDLIDVAKYRNRNEYSMKNLGLDAFELLKELKLIIDDEINAD